MTARILIVDDVHVNLRLMEARLSAEYFEVLTALSGAEAIEICERETIDLVLLDVMMPDMDGYEVCRRLKGNPRTRHLPIVLITALNQPADRVAGLDAGADDFLTKPVRDLQLFSRVRSLVRLKLLSDELRIRAETTISLVAGDDLLGQLAGTGISGRLLVFDDETAIAARIKKVLRCEHEVDATTDPASVLHAETSGAYDLFIVNLATTRYDALRLCSQIRSGGGLRQMPILLISDSSDDVRTAKALELGANDFLSMPLDRNELLARVRTQIKRKRYDEGLRQSLRETIAMAITDPLTGLNNRRFLESHLPTVIQRARADNKPLSVLIADIDHFKKINDGWGHDAGDRVLKEFARRLRDSLRGSDLACRFGGEEFVVVMPEADARTAQLIAERLRCMIADAPFDIVGESISVTVSAGIAVLGEAGDDWESLLKRADQGLYDAKRTGRNRVIERAA